MKKRGMKKGFTLVELLVAVAIIAMLSVAAYIGIQRSQSRGQNERIADDLSAIKNALEQYKQDKGNYPNIADESLKLGKDDGSSNVSCFDKDTAYIHDCSSTDAAFIQAMVDNTVLTKRYLQEVPTDPRTGSRYVYGVTTNGQYYQVAGNWLNDDGSYSAKVVGNTEKGYDMPSLIRAFNGPNFVMDGEGYLPYSPDHLAITARLEEVTGTVTVTAKGQTQPAMTGTVVSPDSVISTGPNSSVILYFSDGSITHLDSNTTLRVLPSTKVEKNDKDGIITKIRLKIFSGKIWSKVARLAKASEFNIETTNSIAGVRGTEFGIDLVTIPNETRLVVLNGSVAARRISTSDTVIGVGTDSYIDFDSATDIDNLTQLASNDGNWGQAIFLPPEGSNPMPSSGAVSPSEQDYIKNTYYKTVFNNNMRPRILEIKTDAPDPYVKFKWLQGLKKIYACPAAGDCASTLITWQGDTDWITDPAMETVSILHLSNKMPGYSGPTANTLIFRFEDAQGRLTGFSSPAVDIKPNLNLTEAEIYNLLAGGGQQQQQQGCAGTLDHIEITGYQTPFVAGTVVQLVATAYYTNPTCQKDVSAEGQWSVLPPALGTFTQNSLHLNQNIDQAGTVSSLYLGKTDQKSITVLSELHFACIGADKLPSTPDDKGYWEGAACWVLAQSNLSCDATCPVVGGVCKDGNDGEPDWDDDVSNPICMTLANAIQPPLNPAPEAKGDAGTNFVFAPHLSTGFFNRCWSRHSNASVSDLCGTTQNMAGEQRVCKCVK